MNEYEKFSQILKFIKYNENNGYIVELPEHISLRKNDKFETVKDLPLCIGNDITGFFSIGDLKIYFELLHRKEDEKVKLNIEYKYEYNDEFNDNSMNRTLEEKLIKYIELKILGFEPNSKLPDYEKHPEEFFGKKYKTKSRMKDSFEYASEIPYDEQYDNDQYDDNDQYNDNN